MKRDYVPRYKENPEKKKKQKNLILLSILALPILFGLLIYQLGFFQGLSRFDGRGTLIRSFMNPTDDLRADVYFIDDGGATVRSSIRVSLSSYNSDRFQDDTVYWEQNYTSTTIEWINDSQFTIAGIPIDINDEETWYEWENENPDRDNEPLNLEDGYDFFQYLE